VKGFACCFVDIFNYLVKYIFQQVFAVFFIDREADVRVMQGFLLVTAQYPQPRETEI